MKRRHFLATTAALAQTAKAAPALAAEGGTPVRATPLKGSFWGTQFYDEKERQQLNEVLDTRSPFRWYGSGPQPPSKVLTFEKEFAARMQTKFALGVTSGTAALIIAMNAIGIGPGDEVILPAWTWHSCFNAVVLAGALPVFAEIDESFNIDPTDIESKITPQTKAILAVHLQGNPADMDRILAIARKHQLKVIEDCAQSVGASYHGRPLGSMGDIGIYSLQLNKTITAGEGGAVVTNDPVLFERAARFHDLGGLRGPHQDWIGKSQLDWFIGSGYRLNEFSGGVLLAQLRKLDTIVNAVRGNARRVHEGLRGLKGAEMRQLPDPQGELGTGVFFGFRNPEQRARFFTAMKAENIPASPPGGSVILPTQKHIENKITVHPAWPSFQSPRGKAIQYGAACCPKTIRILDRFGGVLIDPKYTAQDCADIAAAIRKVYPAVTKA